MKMEEHNNITKEILENLDNQGKVSELLTSLTQDYSEVLENTNTLETKNKELETSNSELTNSNMKLFLKVGDVEKKLNDFNLGVGSGEPGQTSQQCELTYDNLFNNGNSSMEFNY